MSKPLKDGDRVMYARSFLQNIGVVSGLMPSRIGTVASVTGEYAYVRWHDHPGQHGVHVNNLVRADSLHLEDR